MYRQSVPDGARKGLTVVNTHGERCISRYVPIRSDQDEGETPRYRLVIELVLLGVRIEWSKH
jgi:hypothetical protein